MKHHLSLLAFSALLCGQISASEPPRPNILHILADDMGWNALSRYGNKAVATPHLDRLAVKGCDSIHLGLCGCEMGASRAK